MRRAKGDKWLDSKVNIDTPIIKTTMTFRQLIMTLGIIAMITFITFNLSFSLGCKWFQCTSEPVELPKKVDKR